MHVLLLGFLIILTNYYGFMKDVQRLETKVSYTQASGNASLLIWDCSTH